MKLIAISKGTLELARVQLNQPSVVIGRSPTCDVVLRAPGIKAIHYLLEWSGTGDFSPEVEHEGSWVLFNISQTNEQGEDTDEGHLLSSDSTEINGLKFRLISDRLEAKSKIGGRIVKELRSAGSATLTGSHSQVEAIHVRSDSGAIEGVNYISPRSISQNGRAVFKSIPEFRIRSTGQSAPVLDFRYMTGVKVFSKGQECPPSNFALPVSYREVYCIKWKDLEFFVRVVPSIKIPMMPHQLLGDTRTVNLYLAGLGSAIVFFFVLTVVTKNYAAAPAPPPRRVVQIEVPTAPPPPPPKVAEPPPPPPPPPPPVEKIKPVEKIAPKGPEPKTPPKVPVKKATPKVVTPPNPSKGSNAALRKGPPRLAAPRDPNPNPNGVGPASQKAAAQKVAQSLSFLSGPATKNAKVAINTPNTQQGSPVPSSLREQSRLSSKIVAQGDTSNTGGPIETRGSRSFKGDKIAGFGDSPVGSGSILGKVDLKNPGLGGGSGMANLDSTVAGGGASLSGLGTASASEIEKAIQKNIRKFQYCYEKALLSDPNIGGTVQIAWLIVSGGRAQNVRVKSTQIRHNELMNCLKSELAKIAFPSPKGGNVEVEYPFSFTASKL